jgi:hypothetical protein
MRHQVWPRLCRVRSIAKAGPSAKVSDGKVWSSRLASKITLGRRIPMRDGVIQHFCKGGHTRRRPLRRPCCRTAYASSRIRQRASRWCGAARAMARPRVIVPQPASTRMLGNPNGRGRIGYEDPAEACVQ